jgi:MFS family permease
MSRYLYIVILILAGEMVFGLPFGTARFFRPTMLDVFGFTNTQLGDLFAVYGITAMLSYFPGGAIADHFRHGLCWRRRLLQQRSVAFTWLPFRARGKWRCSTVSGE